jgi:uncharacterized protein YacL
MFKKVAYVFGAVFVLLGLLGFFETFTPDGKLLGLFEVGTMHNIIHLLTGLLAFAFASSTEKTARMYFQIFGVVYGLVTVIGFIQGSTVLGLIGVNFADNVLHLVIAVTALYLGFGASFEKDAKTVNQ